MSEREAIGRAPYARTLAAMERLGVDLLLLSRAANGAFVSGSRRVQIAGSGGFVPWVVVGAGAPAPAVYTPDLDGVPDWIGAHARPMAWNAMRILDDLGEIAPAARRIAFDALSPRFLDALAARFPAAAWIDAEEVLAESRASKTEAEVSALAAAARVAGETVTGVARAVLPGTTERALACLASPLAIAAGATFLAREADVRVTTGDGARHRGPARSVRQGDLVSIEVAVFRGAVQGEETRTVIVGAGTPAARDLLRHASAALDSLAAACRGNATGEEIVAALPPGAGGTPFVLHGIGAGVEAPFLDPAAPAGFRLLPGTTVVATAEVREDGVGSARFSRTLAVGAHGARALGTGAGW